MAAKAFVLIETVVGRNKAVVTVTCPQKTVPLLLSIVRRASLLSLYAEKHLNETIQCVCSQQLGELSAKQLGELSAKQNNR